MPATPPPDPDHHLVCNRGCYWVCCSINATRATKEKLSFSLLTKSVELARHRRDVFLLGLQEAGLELRMRYRLPAAVPPPAPAARALPWQDVVRQVLEQARAATPTESSESLVLA